MARFVLSNTFGEAKPGHLLAIMGPSGSGKTTLLNVLAGQLTSSPSLHLSGYLYINGRPMSEGGYKIAYVRQEDLFFSQLTVREMLSLATELQLPDTFAPERKESYVNDLLFRLRLVSAINTSNGCTDKDKMKSIKIISIIGLEELRKIASMNLKPPTKIDVHKSFDENDIPSKSWNSCVKIALGFARALEYLHETCSPSVVHKNFKTSNIFLDSELNPHLSDSGFVDLTPNQDFPRFMANICTLWSMVKMLYTLHSDYMVEKLGIEESKIENLGNLLYKNYDMTMASLRAVSYSFDYDEYHSFVHGRLPYENIKLDPVLKHILKTQEAPSQEHADMSRNG
ncbi:hypothetical protein GUJ93_ZPchr0010g11065 [Zizania palustris]|uniref:Protein kinase domain-containing protein n=1 Tax=Zizania palustris TaxID=103762 RepID=A0A8J5WD92_ZIZPA|nr:hypothetical protein GUJ93_ZPchr0010g11065 [Zizania palustris]